MRHRTARDRTAVGQPQATSASAGARNRVGQAAARGVRALREHEDQAPQAGDDGDEAPHAGDDRDEAAHAGDDGDEAPHAGDDHCGAEARLDGEQGAQAAEYAMVGGIAAACCAVSIAFVRQGGLERLWAVVLDAVERVVRGWF